ncbi:MAG: hypothetical protein LBD53_09450 [Tannerella sp.]|nr:hypothetical protein [Tannerella sp.]
MEKINYDLHFNTAFTDSAYVASGKMYSCIKNYPASFLCLSGITKDSLSPYCFVPANDVVPLITNH